MSRVLIAVVIGLILALGAFFYIRLRPSNTDEAGVVTQSESAEPGVQVVLTPTMQPNATMVRVAGYDVQLNPDPQVAAYLASEGPANPTQAAPRATATAISPTATPRSTTASGQAVVVTTVIQPTPQPTARVTNQGTGSITLVNHTVVSGDTLYGIARTYGTTVDLMAQYDIAQGNMIPGNVIAVPIASSAACTSTSRSHVVSQGENVFRIAIAYGSTKERIRDANGLGNDYLIRVGQVLCIP